MFIFYFPYNILFLLSNDEKTVYSYLHFNKTHVRYAQVIGLETIATGY